MAQRATQVVEHFSSDRRVINRWGYALGNNCARHGFYLQYINPKTQTGIKSCCVFFSSKQWFILGISVNAEVLLSSIGELVQGVSGDDVAADELHRRVALRGLLPQDGAGKHGVVPTLLTEVNFNLKTHNHGCLSTAISRMPTRLHTCMMFATLQRFTATWLYFENTLQNK